ncbi:hypothetical protein HED51_23870 [Ochrobactrum grignonense]|nr:hypothetical protein [Brucella grignonensis]
MRQFSAAGLYRYSAEFPNFDFDFRHAEVVFTDLDSSLFLDGLEPPARARQILRDAASMIYHLVAKFSGPTALGAYTIKALLKSDPIYAALRGYFHQLNEDDAKRVSQRLWQLYLPHFYLLNMHRDRIIGEWSQERRRSYKMDHHLFFLAVMYFFYGLLSAQVIARI